MTNSKFDPQKPFDAARGRHHRHSMRLPEYDYSQPGAYFVTIVAWHRECLFGEVINGDMKLDQVGKIVEWKELPKRFRSIELGGHVVMPNHFHGILIFHEHVGAVQQGSNHTLAADVSSPNATVDAIDGSIKSR